MPKPFRFDELLARIRLRLRSGRRTGAPTVLRPAARAWTCARAAPPSASAAVELTAREFALRRCSCATPARCSRREQLLSQVWGYDFDPGSNVVDVYVRYLRRKLGAELIETVRGMGYRLDVVA